jgi:NAD(P)-dependent dehydrogenase (short-subunit alcohol dehydrogenase family)
MPLLHQRIALITGASKGIGAAVAQRFASEGAHVIAIGRDAKGLEATDDAIRAAGGTATLVPLDLMEMEKIEWLAASVAQRFGRLDILVGNAALLGELTPLPHTNPEDWHKVMAINVDANWQLIRCFDALLKQSDAPRAMFVTSGVARRTAAYWGAYAVSKSALEAMVRIYAEENRKTPLKANLIDPGAVRTRMRAKAFPGEDPQALADASAITDIFVTLASAGLQETGQVFSAQAA